MQIVSIGNSLHEMSKSVTAKDEKAYFNISSALNFA